MKKHKFSIIVVILLVVFICIAVSFVHSANKRKTESTTKADTTMQSTTFAPEANTQESTTSELSSKTSEETVNQDTVSKLQFKLVSLRKFYVTKELDDGQTYTEDHIEYSYKTPNGEIIQDEKKLLFDYAKNPYSISFSISKTAEESVVIENDHSSGIYKLNFVVTEETYKELFG